MASLKKILLITEGPEDKKVLSRIFRAYGKEVDIVTFKMNVYKLIDLYESQNTEYENIDLQQTLLYELADLKQSEVKILQDRYVDKFLIFDFDPHAPQARLDKLENFIKYFRDSSDMGKLYINYPMMESYQHVSDKKLRKLEIDQEFLSRRFDKEDFVVGSRVAYKTRAKREGFTRRALSKQEWNWLISHHLYKLEQTVGSLRQSDFSQNIFLDLFKQQCANFQKDQSGLVLNTSLALIPELYPADWEDMTSRFETAPNI